MGASGLSAGDERALSLLAEGLAGVLAGGGRSVSQKVAVLRRVEGLRRRLATVDHALINDVDAADVHSLGGPDVAALLVRELRIAPGEARARVRAAADLGPRRMGSGAVVGPVFPTVAAAMADGQISVEHAAVIRRAVDALPGLVEAEHGERFTADLLAQATTVHPGELARTAARAAAAIDPDAGLSDAEIEHRRDASLLQRGDGMFALTAVLTPECGAAWRTVFDSLAAPAPALDGTPDPRTAGQRMHDALREIPLMLLRTTALPDCGGVVATLLVTMTTDQARIGHGLRHDQPRRPDPGPADPRPGRRLTNDERRVRSARRRSSTTAAPAASPPPGCDSRSTPATRAAPSPAATAPRNGPKPTTSTNGTATTAAPPCTTSDWSAATTTDHSAPPDGAPP